MTADQIVELSEQDGVQLFVSPSGGIKAKGNQYAINLWRSIIQQNKPAIVKLLKKSIGVHWSEKDWQEYFDERAGIAEYSGGLSRDQAEVRAYDCCLGEWLRRNPVSSPAGLCELCGQPKGMLTPYLTDYYMKDPGYTWLHQACSERWFSDRRLAAIQALRVLGITNLSNH
jgi:hypothetical protein